MENVKLNFVHISENAFFSQEGKLNVIGIFDKIFSDSFPALHPIFAISVGIIGKKGLHKILIEIVAPQKTQEIIKIEKTDIEIKEDGSGANFVANLIGIPFPDPGIYTLKVTLDDSVVDEGNRLILEKKSNV